MSQVVSVASSAPLLTFVPVNPEQVLADIRERVGSFIATHPEADLRTVARALHMAPRTLQRALAEARAPFIALRTRVRLELACRLLVAPDSKVECVARDVGFASTPHFIGWFRRYRGATPSDYRRSARALGGPPRLELAEPA